MSKDVLRLAGLRAALAVLVAQLAGCLTYALGVDEPKREMIGLGVTTADFIGEAR